MEKVRRKVWEKCERASTRPRVAKWAMKQNVGNLSSLSGRKLRFCPDQIAFDVAIVGSRLTLFPEHFLFLTYTKAAVFWELEFNDIRELR